LESLLQQRHPDSVAILEVLTPAYVQAYQLQNALECVSRWLEYEPDNLQAWHYRSQVFGRLQVVSKVLVSDSRILELDPENDEVRLRYAGELLQANRPQQASGQYQYLRQRLGDTPLVLCGLAGCLRALRQPAEARGLLEIVLAEDPRNALALAERSRLAMQEESPPEAEKWFRRALAERPSEHDLLYGLYQCLQRMGREREAAEAQAKFKAVESDLLQLHEVIQQIAGSLHNAELRYQAGMILLRNGKDKEALRWLASALVEEPRHAATHRSLAG
jgi:tetratricopeptide (TPR) repeat protein